MSKINVEHDPSSAKLEVMGVYDWPIWSKEKSTFPWKYDTSETCYLLEGEVIITPAEGGTPVKLTSGDLVTFPNGLSCIWDIQSPVKKHYKFG